MKKTRIVLVPIFDYACPHLYLQDVWEAKKKEKPLYSLRAWSRDLGFSSNTTLSLLLKKKRPFTKKQAVKFIKNLKFTSNEADYFECLIDYSHQVTEQEKIFFEKKLNRIRMVQRSRGIPLDSFEYFSSPVVMMTSEIIGLKNFKNDAKWIQDKIDSEVDVNDVLSAIDLLKKLSLVIEDENGILARTNCSMHYEHQSPIDHASLLYHQSILEMAKKKVGKHSSNESKLSGYFFNVQNDKVIEAIVFINDFIDTFIHKFEAEAQSGEETYQFSLQFLPVTKKSS